MSKGHDQAPFGDVLGRRLISPSSGSIEMTDEQTVAALRSIRSVKARYFRCVDDHDWDGVSDLFTPAASIAYGAEPKSRAVAMAESAAHMARYESVHNGYNAELYVDSPVSAHGRWHVQDRLYRRVDGFDDLYNLIHGFAYYDEIYECLDGRWLIAGLVFTRTRKDLRMGVRKTSSGAGFVASAIPGEEP